MRRFCQKMTAAGKVCTFPPMRGQPVCYQHSDDPAIVAARHEARVRGGLHNRWFDPRPAEVRLASHFKRTDRALLEMLKGAT